MTRHMRLKRNPQPHFMDPRHAGRIRRYHTYPHLGEQNNGEHSWDVLRILLAIWPDCPRHMLVHCVIHDIGELGSGDSPAYAKRNSPVLKQETARIERSTYLHMMLPWYLPPAPELTTFEKIVFKLAEAMEIFEWAWYQFNMGNRYAEHAIAVHRGLIEERAEELKQIQEKGEAPEGVSITTILLRASNYYERRDKVESDIYGNSSTARDVNEQATGT